MDLPEGENRSQESSLAPGIVQGEEEGGEGGELNDIMVLYSKWLSSTKTLMESPPHVNSKI